MPEIATLRIDIFLRLFSLCLRTCYRLLKIIIIILAIRQRVALVRSPILSALPYDKGLHLSVRLPPFFLHIRTHRLHADQILQSMGTSPNYSNLCYTYRVNAGQTFIESITASQNSPTNRVCGTMSKAAGFIFWRIFPASC